MHMKSTLKRVNFYLTDVLVKQLIVVVIFFLTGCSQSKPNNQIALSVPKQPSQRDILRISQDEQGYFGEEIGVLSTEDLIQLSDTQIEGFLSYMNNPGRRDVPRYRRVYDYLENATYRFDYRGATYVAHDSLSRQQGNCMSLALLTTALARLANVKVGYQLIDSTPVFDVGNNAVVKGVHVRSKLYEHTAKLVQGGRKFTFNREGVIVDYFPEGSDRFLNNLSENDFFARYYRNRAVDYLQQGDYSSSYWYTRKSMALVPLDSEGMNLMAILYKRVGDRKKAEEIFQYGLLAAKDKLSLLKNYRQLLAESKRFDEVKAIENRIENYDDPSPYPWLSLADQAKAQGRLTMANKYYRNAIDRAPYLQFGYLGLAKTYFIQGRLGESEKMLRAAMQRNFNSDNGRLYQAKLAYLESQKD